MNRPLLAKILLIAQIVALTALAGLLLLTAANSLDWRMEHDTPLLHYAAFLMDKYGLVPYRDIFETSMPGTFAFHFLVGKLFGYGDLAFRLVDLVLLGLLLAATYVFMSRFGRLPAIWAAVLFGTLYLAKGQWMSLQRDYIGIIPIALALLCIPAKTDKTPALPRFALVGALFGISALIKPQLAITLPVVFAVLLAFRWDSRKSALDLLTCGAVCGVSFLIPILIAVLWLAANGALAQFTSILIEYLPLHNALTGELVAVTASARALYLIKSTLQFGGYGALLLGSLFGCYRVATHAGQDKAITRPLVGLLLCTLLYAVYPTLAGKFWPYHYMPLAYFAAATAGLCLFAWPQSPNSRFVRWIGEALVLLALLVVVVLQVEFPTYIVSVVNELRTGPEMHAPKWGRVDEIAGWLRSRLHPGDSVQPLDWVGGSIHAMLLAEAKLATPFMYDYHFYHHVSTPYIQGLRESFISQLRQAMPRFIIEVDTDKPWVSGIDTTRSFPELRELLDTYYAVAFTGNGYLIYERKDDSP